MNGESDDKFTERLAAAWAEEVGKYDRNLLALTTGALALSAALVRDLEELEALPVLGTGWLSLVLTLFLALGSSVFSKIAIEARWDHNKNKGDKYSRRAWRVSLAAGALFAIGALCLMTFAWFNID